MTWTYTGDPSATDRDEVRFLIGDTDFNKPLVQDEEIAYAVAQEGNNRMAAVRVARAIAFKYGSKVDKAVGDLRLSYSQLHKQYLSLAKVLAADAAVYGGIPYAGGIGVSDKDGNEAKVDRVEPNIRIGMHDNPDAITDNNNNN